MALFTLVALTITVALLQTLTTVSALPGYVSRVPNGANVPGTSAVGHTSPDGRNGYVNGFGSAFGDAGDKWAVALCRKDSDGDGQTNGEELGDPCCEWTTAKPIVRWASGLSHPGDKTKTSNATRIANANCSTVEAAKSAAMASSYVPPAEAMLVLALLLVAALV